MDRNSDSITKEITYIALGVATILVGGIVIFQLSLVFPIPCVKYILLAPYLSMMIYILLSKIKRKNVLLKIGFIFGLIMIVINLFMGMTIIITTILSQLTSIIVPSTNKAFYGAVFFSGYTGVSALIISKYLIGGVFKDISSLWMIFTALICAVFGILGTLLAKKILRHLEKYSH